VPGVTEQVVLEMGVAMQKAYLGRFRIVFIFLATIPFGALLIVFAALSPNFGKF
jgi:hypothetical protein